MAEQGSRAGRVLGGQASGHQSSVCFCPSAWAWPCQRQAGLVPAMIAGHSSKCCTDAHLARSGCRWCRAPRCQSTCGRCWTSSSLQSDWGKGAGGRAATSSSDSMRKQWPWRPAGRSAESTGEQTHPCQAGCGACSPSQWRRGWWGRDSQSCRQQTCTWQGGNGCSGVRAPCSPEQWQSPTPAQLILPGSQGSQPGKATCNR